MTDGPYFVLPGMTGATLVERSSTDPLVVFAKANGTTADMRSIALALNKASQAQS